MSKRIISRLWFRSMFLFAVLLATVPLAIFTGCSSGGGKNPVQEEAPVSEDSSHSDGFGDSSHSDGYDCLASEYYKTYDELIQCVPCDNRRLGDLYYMGMNQNIPFGQETPIGDVKYRCVQSLVDGSYSWKRSDSISFFEYDWGYLSMISRDSALVAQNLRNLKHGTMTDSRDGQVYKTVTIGTQTWMAENLNYRYLGATFDRDSSSFCYNCAKYGRLYLLSAAVDSAGLIEGNVANGCGIGAERMLIETIRGVCPEGWHLPQIEEWDNLVGAITVHGEYTRGLSKLRSTSGWEEGTVNGNGDDSSSFSALPAGYLGASICKMGSSLCAGEYCCEGRDARFWSYGYGKAWVMRLTDNDPGGVVLLGNDHISGDAGYSVRCVKDENVNASSSLTVSSSSVASSSSSETYSLIASSSSNVSSSSIAYEIGTMTDSRDRQVYKTVTIGSQTWMAENLNYEAKEGSYCYDEGDLKTENCDEYGRMYNWASAVDACPVTWRLPTRGEWEALLQFASGEYRDGFALKSSTGWNSDGNGGDVYGFSALPVTCEYGISGIQTSFWSATESSSGYAYMLTLNYDTDFSALNHRPKVTKCPVRCIKDAE